MEWCYRGEGNCSLVVADPLVSKTKNVFLTNVLINNLVINVISNTTNTMIADVY